ncbi:MAG: acetylxylan esterase, partial [Phycisphaerae bacterium]|nr:acetylxylan esterase [Phycisphaerae bacterium]
MAWKNVIQATLFLGVAVCGCGAAGADQKRVARPWEHKITDDLHVKKYPGNKVMWDLLTRLAYEMHDDALSGVTNREQWKKERPVIREHFLYMLALEHAIKKPVKAVVAAKAEADGYVAEAIVHSTYEGCSGQGLLMYPRKITKPLPLIIWGDNWGMGPGSVSGPLKVGMKWVQDGYAIFFLDTVGHSHHKSVALYGKWWWLSHGQNEPGENVIRYLKAIDYLSTRKEIDPKRIGVFGISGWGACTWSIAALDERVAAAVPALPSTALAKASISSPELGLTEKPEWIRTRKIKANWKGLTASAGGCDQAYFYNCYRRDAADIEALCAPRNVLEIAGQIDDFSQGASAVHAKMKKVWDFYPKRGNLALYEHSGGHNLGPLGKVKRDEWFVRHLKPTAMTQLKDSPDALKDLIKSLAKWKKTPDSWGNPRKRPEIWSFVKLAKPPAIKNAGQWEKYKKKVLADLKEKVFGGFP